MKIIIIIILVFLSSEKSIYSQKVSDYLNCSTELGSIEINGKASTRKIKRIGIVKKKNLPKLLDNHDYKTRYFEFGDTIQIIQHKSSFWDFRFQTSAIDFKYPSQVVTHKGIQIGKSTEEEVIAAYGEPDKKFVNQIIYEFPNNIWLLFSFYDIKETDADYNPKLKDKVISIFLD